MFPTIGLLVASTLLRTAPPQELTLEQVIKANTAAIQAIRSIHVTIQESNQALLDDEEPPLEPLPTYTYEWFKDGNRERVRKIWLRGKGVQGKQPSMNSDVYNGPDGWKRLGHYDPNFKPPLSESISGPARGEIEKTDPKNLLSNMLRYTCNMLLFGVPPEKFLLKHPSCKLAATPAISKLGCYEITRLLEKRETPFDSTGIPGDVREIRVFVDPKAGFWIRRIDAGPWIKSTNRNDKYSSINENQEFKDCGNGIFWPMRNYTNLIQPDGKVWYTTINRYTLHSINQPLTDEDFQIPFMDWLRVYDRVSGKVFIWGPDNKPRREFASKAEYEEWYRSRAQDPFQPQIPSSRQYWISLVGISAAVALLLLAIMVWRRRAARVVAKSSPETGNT